MPEITREDIIVVARVYNNSYGDLLWTDKEGKEYKVSNKRVKYFDKIILPDTAVKLFFALSTSGTEYVHKAVKVEGELPPPTKPSELLPEHQKEIKKATQPKPNEPAPQAVGMTTKELGDMIRAKQLIPIFGVEIGAELVKWYRSQILGTTRIPFDGDKLPKIKTEEKEQTLTKEE